MIGLVYATPKSPPPVTESSWLRMKITWTGANGDTFNLSDWRSGVFIRQEGVEGLGHPGRDDWASALSPFLHGQEYRGFVVQPRDIFLPLYLYADAGSAAWGVMDARFWATLRPGEYGTLTVETPGSTRTITARFKAVDDTFSRDPFYFGWTNYGLTLVADDPFWYGPEASRTWEQPAPADFFGGAAKATPFHITSASVLSTAKMTNAGDVEAWPVWEVKGPFTSVSLGVDGQQVSFASSVVEGQVFRMDSDPRDQTAYVDDQDVTGQLGSYGFAPIPSGEARPLNLNMAGTGTVKATIRPRHFRAWG